MILLHFLHFCSSLSLNSRQLKQVNGYRCNIIKALPYTDIWLNSRVRFIAGHPAWWFEKSSLMWNDIKMNIWSAPIALWAVRRHTAPLRFGCTLFKGPRGPFPIPPWGRMNRNEESAVQSLWRSEQSWAMAVHGWLFMLSFSFIQLEFQGLFIQLIILVTISYYMYFKLVDKTH